MATKPSNGNDLGNGAVIGGDDLAQILGIEAQPIANPTDESITRVVLRALKTNITFMIKRYKIKWNAI